MADTASGLPWQLDNRDWLANRLLKVGTRTIAKELGCARATVDRRVREFGISQSVGQRRGRSLAVAAPAGKGRATGTVTFTGTLAQIVERFQRESRTGGPAPSKELLIARIRACHEADQAGDQLAFEDA